MEVLLKNIGYILENAPNSEIKAYAKSLLHRIADEEKHICEFYLVLVAKYLSAMDPGSSWNSLEVLAETTKDWLVFDKKYINEDIYLPGNSVDDSRPDYFEQKHYELLAASGEFDD